MTLHVDKCTFRSGRGGHCFTRSPQVFLAGVPRSFSRSLQEDFLKQASLQEEEICRPMPDQCHWHTECIIVQNSICVGAGEVPDMWIRGTVELHLLQRSTIQHCGRVEEAKSHHLRIGPWSKPGPRPSSVLQTHPCH